MPKSKSRRKNKAAKKKKFNRLTTQLQQETAVKEKALQSFLKRYEEELKKND